MRAFLYGRLTTSGHTGVHNLAIEYFQALPEPEKVVTLEDLAPVIELYHHLVKAGKFDEACELFRDRIENPTFFQLSAYHLRIELLRQLFPGGEGGGTLPRLKTEAAQAWTLAALANTYALSGQPAKAVPLYLMQNKLQEKNEDKKNLAAGLGNVASDQLLIGQFSASSTHLRKDSLLGKEIDDVVEIASSHQELGRVRAFQGKDGGASAEAEWAQSTAYWEKEKHYQGLSVGYCHRSLTALLQARLYSILPGEENRAGQQSREALEQALRALEFAEKTMETRIPVPRDFIQAYWLLGEALIQCRVSKVAFESFDIPFYDEYFQGQTHAVPAAKGKELTAGERCLHEALRRCRKVNLVEMEPDILLTLARLDRAKHLPPNQKYLEEAHTIAQRAGFRVVSADLHLLCGQILLDGNAGNKPLGLTAKEHLEQAQEYALDVSEFEHLYQSPDPDFYKGIEEYDMLKRGMTRQERVENGYWVAYRIAEELLKKLKRKKLKSKN
jgi:hypothetical protein